MVNRSPRIMVVTTNIVASAKHDEFVSNVHDAYSLYATGELTNTQLEALLDHYLYAAASFFKPTAYDKLSAELFAQQIPYTRKHIFPR